ncbi:hypothetical protein N7516_007780 [Penicillium verrucosum]|uniref:uncharacterized protein n=1 Tax=Penicillium verrucosum TaxID=60171 RepID=UPI002545B4CA|nr:uncharacterized protein N7516_007780 [Penicillium verrucosum]KAJ5933291.1 hypothetical protein N7516_007780 [Penicillium verrucosum]
MDECDHLDTDEVPFPQRPIVILGAGIIGCATARQLLLNGFPVILVAEYLPGDQNIYYASAWAGAAWHAAGGITPDQRYLQAVTHRILLKMAQDGPEAGVSIVNAREYLEQKPAPDSAIWDPTRHMPYLKKQVESLGGHFIRQRVESLQELYDIFPESRVFINASGWGSKTLTDVQDDNCFPERGQNVFLATDQCHTLYLRNGKEYTYVIPRPLSNGVILGGVKQQGNLSPEVDMDIAWDEIARAHRLAPEIVPEQPAADKVSYIIGIRPSRKGGFRLESERKGNRVVLSAYGFGGGGFAFSYGIADALVKMVERVERENVI